ncbi:MAG: hypothetical protein ACYCZJ_07305 [Sulfuriferula sp.]
MVAPFSEQAYPDIYATGNTLTLESADTQAGMDELQEGNGTG